VGEVPVPLREHEDVPTGRTDGLRHEVVRPLVVGGGVYEVDTQFEPAPKCIERLLFGGSP
jgi:hypothetical protein